MLWQYLFMLLNIFKFTTQLGRVYLATCIYASTNHRKRFMWWKCYPLLLILLLDVLLAIKYYKYIFIHESLNCSYSTLDPFRIICLAFLKWMWYKFNIQVAALAQLHHPHIIRYRDNFASVDDQLVIVMVFLMWIYHIV